VVGQLDGQKYFAVNNQGDISLKLTLETVPNNAFTVSTCIVFHFLGYLGILKVAA
jgi:hypothetical protein